MRKTTIEDIRFWNTCNYNEDMAKAVDSIYNLEDD